jgi:hypothetical protein
MVWGMVPTPYYCSNRYTAGPPRQVYIDIVAPVSEINQIVVQSSTNADVSIPALPSPLPTVLVTQIDPNQFSTVVLQVSGGQGPLTCPATIAGGANQWTEALSPMTGDVTLVLDQQQEFEAFARGWDSSLWQAAQTSVNGPWGGWQSLGGVITGDPAPILEQTSRMAIFAVGSDSGVRELEQTGTPPVWPGAAWSPLGGVAVGNTAAATTSNQLGVFVRGSDLAVWEDAQAATTVGNTFPGWSSLGGYLLSDPVVVSDNNTDLYVFAHSGDGSLWMTWQPQGGSWIPWSSLGGGLFIGNPAVVRDGSGELEVYVRGTDNAVWRNVQVPPGGLGNSPVGTPAGWTGWTSLGGYITSDPVAALNPGAAGGSAVEVFGRGGDNAVWQIAQTTAGGAFGPWTSLGGIVGTNVQVRTTSDGRLQVFAQAPDNSVWQIAQIFPGPWN